MIRGRKLTATVLKIQRGNPGKRRLPENEPHPVGAIKPPAKLTGRARALWNEFVVPAFWLTWADAPKAFMWCCLQAEFERAPASMVAARIGQLRALGSELGFDPSSRARLGTPAPLLADAPSASEETLESFLARRPGPLSESGEEETPTMEA